MGQKKRLFLLDAYALIFRGYYALIKNPRINSKGRDTSAIMGFMNSLFDVIKRENPDHLAVCFDKAGSDVRTEIYSEYKANRDETPQVIEESVPTIKTILEAMHIPTLEIPGVEADDIIGTLAKQAEKENYEVYMVTPDKDFGQLVSDNIFMYRPARMGNAIEIWGIPEVQKRFGVERPEQVIDYLGMMGDSVDNIPGLPGVGDKTAKKFLKQFGSIENLLNSTNQLKGKMKEKLESHKKQGLMSKKLATIDTESEVEFHAGNFEMSEPDQKKVEAIFQELEFRRLAEQFRKLFFEDKSEISTEKENGKASQSQQFSLFDTTNQDEKKSDDQGYKTIHSQPHFYQYIDSEMAINQLIKRLNNQTKVCFDTETTGLNTFEAELVGIAFSWEKGKGYYVPFPKDQYETRQKLAYFRDFFANGEIEKVGQNLKYDYKILARYGIVLKGKFFDTMLAHYLINPDMRHNMDVLAETYLNYSPKPIEDLIGKKGKKQKSMRSLSIEEQTEYAVEDADITYQLREFFINDLKKANNEKLFDELEIPLLSVLAKMELNGIDIDEKALEDLSKKLSADIDQLEKQIHEAAGEKFNIGSPKQLGDILFGKLELAKKPKKTKSGQYSTAEDVLAEYAQKHQIVADVLQWRQLSKLQNTYVDALPKQVQKSTGKIHTEFMQTVAATGRLSSNNPNLQNIPIRTERGREIRKAFIPSDNNHVLMAADYSQIELRVIASLSEETNMIQAFRDGKDIHATTASQVFDVPLDEVTREQRSNAKTINFGIIYGVSAYGLSQQTSLTRQESKTLIDTYYAAYPKLSQFIEDQVAFARENGYVKTVLDRRRYLKDINARNHVVRSAAERNAVNAPVQGSAADIIKIAMIAVQKNLEKNDFKSKLLLQIHDELIFDVPKDEVDDLKEMVQQKMSEAYELKVPLDVDIGTGVNWLEAH
ncbi:MAG: DNA polymerase I [Psychroflexus sp.]|nr:DNA polymerase I [Psychroflexus sp.]